MKNRNHIILVLLLSSLYHSCFATTGLFFNAVTNGRIITIMTTVPHKTYSYAGIQLTTPGYTLTHAGTECIPQPNGLCKFTSPISDTLSQQITVSGPEGYFNFFLCLNAHGHLTCQNQYGSRLPSPV